MLQSALAIQPVHTAAPGRVRYAVPALRRKPEYVAEVERVLRGVQGVTDARGSARTGTLLIHYDPAEPRSPWMATLATLLGSSPASVEFDAPPTTSEARPSRRAVARVASMWRSHAVEPIPSRARQEPAIPSAAVRRDERPEPAAVDEVAWHGLSIGDVLSRTESAPDGLGSQEARRRLERHGPNRIAAAARRSELRIFVDQLASTPVAMLGASAVVSAATGGVGDALAILSVVGINAGIGYATESGAERTIAALTRVPQQSVPVRRDGVVTSIPLDEVVRGDVLALQAGIFVAADARVLTASDLTIDESSLTGESMPVLKSREALEELSTPLADRTNMVFRGTLVTGGSGAAVVVATGAETQLGYIQQLAGAVEQRDTPMQRQLEQLSKQLAIGAGAACLGMLGIGLLRGQALLPLIRTAVSLGVAAVPEGLPTVAMTTLALGLARMRDERVLVRQLAAVETLGATQVVCLDKTGTLTVNRMTVVAAEAGLTTYQVRQGEFIDEAGTVSRAVGDIEPLLRVAVLCNEVELEQDGGVTVLRGSPTESALVQLALDAGVDVASLRAASAQRDIQRRAQARNYMTTTHEVEGGALLAVKGRPSEVLTLCGYVVREGRRVPLGDDERARIERSNERMAGRALRVLGFALREGAAGADETPGELVWVGLIGMEDPPREGVSEVLARFRAAGVRAIMITGDQSATAQAVGRQIGLGSGDRLEIVDSTRLDSVAPEVLGSLAERADVFSRVSPAHKLHIVRALQQRGYVVAMTGDGVNDGPALKAADIGVAMGAGGSVAAREVADIVLEDDELRTLIKAIEQGRTIYDDIRKAVRFILATNLSELLFTITCVASGAGEPLSPIQLLWINLLTDIFPELALATQPPEADVLTRPPRDPHRPMFTRDDLMQTGFEGLSITAGAFGAYFTAARGGGAGPRARTVGFSTLMFAQLLHAFSARSESHGIFDRTHVDMNRWLPIAVGGTALVQMIVSLVPPLRAMLGVVPLSARDWGRVALGAVVPFLVNEAAKRVRGSHAVHGLLAEHAKTSSSDQTE